MADEHALAYVRLRERVTELVLDADPAALEQRAPATPAWRVHDVLAHMVGVADDIVNGRRDGVGSDEWTAAQVERRSHLSRAELLADWDEWAPGFEQLLGAGPPEAVGQAIFDAVTHEHDIRHALARPGARDSDAVAVGWEWFLTARTRAGAGAIRFVTEGGDGVGGTGDPFFTVQARRFELVRAITGRRTFDEIAAFDWSPEPEPHAICGPPLFTIRSESLGE